MVVIFKVILRVGAVTSDATELDTRYTTVVKLLSSDSKFKINVV